MSPVTTKQISCSEDKTVVLDKIHVLLLRVDKQGWWKEDLDLKTQFIVSIENYTEDQTHRQILCMNVFPERVMAKEWTLVWPPGVKKRKRWTQARGAWLLSSICSHKLWLKGAQVKDKTCNADCPANRTGTQN